MVDQVLEKDRKKTIINCLFYITKKHTEVCIFLIERMMGAEPTLSAWKAEVLPLNYIRKIN